MKITKLIMGGSLVVFLALVSIGSFVASDREFSENENRYLAQFPEISIDSIFDCDFQDGLEKYMTLARGEEWTGGDVFDDFCHRFGGALNVRGNGCGFRRMSAVVLDAIHFPKNAH